MQFEYRLKIDLKDSLKQDIENIIFEFLRLSKATRIDIDKFYIADEDNFGKALKEIDKDETYTNNEIIVAAAKTASYYKEKSVVSSIILRDFVMGVVLNWKHGYTNDIDEVDELLNLYVIPHELGHCYDNKIRKHLNFSPLRNNDNLFKINTVNMYYYEILLSELSACVFSAYAVNEGIVQYEINNLVNHIDQMMKNISILKIEYYSNNEVLYNLAFEVSGLFWFILIQFSKLIGFKIGNKDLSNISILENANYGFRDEYLLEELESLLIKSWDSYPNFELSLEKKVCEIWSKLCLSNGYEYKVGDVGDGFWWK